MTVRLHTPLAEHFADIAEVVHIFYPEAAVVPAELTDCDILHEHADEEGVWVQETFRWGADRFEWTARIAGDHWERKRRRKRALKQACYYLLKARTGMSPPWGSLTGIRPTRLLYEQQSKGIALEEGEARLVRLFDIAPDRAQLVCDTVRTQRGLIESPENAVDLYIGIPFCPTRCAYCSFFAEAVGKGKKLAPYLAALEREVDALAELVRAAALVPRALYIGGGTPTVLSAAQLEALLLQVRRHFSSVRELTVEAGRPDTLTPERLSALLDGGATRICINPQTMCDATLEAIGRQHTAEDTVRAFRAARAAGFDSINMDIIAALPGETEARFEETLDAIEWLGPEGLTVHTLAKKHGSRFNEFGYDPVSAEAAAAMTHMARQRAERMGMRPYYLYRQKYVAGNLENVGYAMAGRESLYNIDIMEETTSVLAAGAGAISKRVMRGEGRIERAPNVGDVGHYMARVDEMIIRKRALWGFS